MELFKPEQSLFINGAVDAQTSSDVIMGMSKLYSADPKKMITLFISSGGGSVGDAFALYDYTTKALKPKLQTVALGEVNSTAVMLFLMGDTRYIGRLSVMRFHKFSLIVENTTSLTTRKADQIRQDLERSEAEYVNIITSRSGGKITADQARTFLDNNIAVPAIQAVKLGLAHHLL